ncbi:MAG: rRNA pseudouridine synthase [Gammaproteobacteria bacterium]|nr:rRNA pseudouridine synthase [Gammaproteobacteria bacterium]
MDERLHKLLAQHGIGSRRQVESWIRDGRVLVNGRPAEVGQRVRPGDRIVVDGRDVTRRLGAAPELRVIVYHKPSGEMLRRLAGDERTGVEMHLPALRSGRWLPVNALGFGEDGLLVLANEGALVSAVTRRASSIPVEYRVRALRPRQSDDWPQMPREVEVEGEPVTFSAIERLEGGTTNTWFKVSADRTLPRGAIRSLFDAAGLKVSRTMLVRWGPVSLPRDLPRGRSRDLAGAELDALLALAGRTGADARPARRATDGSGRGRGPGRSAGRATARRSGGR